MQSIKCTRRRGITVWVGHAPNDTPVTIDARDLMQEILGKWNPEEPFVIIDHQGQQAMDAAAYFLGHDFKNVRCLRGGIDAWSLEVDDSVSRYEFS